MHGRLKVKTTAEQAEEKRKHREKKLKLFQGAKAAAFKKITAKEYDREGLHITQEILTANSDYYTVWNYRKNTFLHYKSTKSTEELLESFQAELSFIQNCLKNNPKSYSCWNHRCFVLLTMPEPDWKKELQLCNLFLQYDERNFHCWDYRRFVVQHSAVSPSDEINFTHKLIENNFSNYSSWHHRSKLLPIQCPDLNDPNRIGEKMLLEELELVQNAFFTDPNDQSAWFYHRWLLGRGETKQSITCLHVSKPDSRLTCTLRKPVSLAQCSSMKVYLNGQQQYVTWTGVGDQKYQHAWHCQLANELLSMGSSKISVEFASSKMTVEVAQDEEQSISCIQTSPETFRQNSSDAKLSVLAEELNSCQELNELEPGNKWVMLTLVLLMRAIDPVQYSSRVSGLLCELCVVDSMRCRYYQDLQSKYQIEDYIAASLMQNRTLNISGKGLTYLCRLEFFTSITHLNVSNNQLQSLNSPLSLLHCLEELDASKNQIKEINGLSGLRNLTVVILDSNQISFPMKLGHLTTCTAIQKISIKLNPVSSVSDLLSEMFPNAEIVY